MRKRFLVPAVLVLVAGVADLVRPEPGRAQETCPNTRCKINSQLECVWFNGAQCWLPNCRWDTCP